MKILRIVSQLDFGGVERVIETTLLALANIEDVSIKVLVLGKGGRVANLLVNQGIDLTIWNENPKIPNLALIFKIRQYCLGFKPDVVHCQGAEANFHGILGSSLANVPIRIAEEIGIPNHHSYWKYIFRLVYRKASSVIAVAQKVKNRLIELKEVPNEKIIVLYNPIDEKTLAESNSKCRDLAMITVSRLVPIKNLYFLISCFAQISETYPEWKLWIIGEGPEKENLIRLVRENQLKEKVIFFGFLSDPISKLSQAEIFLLPSLSEGSPVALAEAMSVGLPSIVTQVGGASEILGNSNSGILIDPLDADCLKSAMQKLMDLSQEERYQMGKRAKEEAERFSVENYINELMKVYAG